MKIPVKRCLHLLAIAMLSAGVARAAQPAFSLSISTPEKVVRLGTELKVKIRLTNTSKEEIYISREKSDELGEFNYGVEVRDLQGKKQKETKYFRKLQTDEDLPGEYSIIVSSPWQFKLNPGESLEDGVIINKLFNISEPGKYAIQVERLDEQVKTKVKSNKMMVTQVD